MQSRAVASAAPPPTQKQPCTAKKEKKAGAPTSPPIPIPGADTISEVVEPIALPEPASTIAVAPSLMLERRVHLRPEDRAKVSWLWQPTQPPATRPFDYEKCVAEAKEWFHSPGYMMAHQAELAKRMTPDEAWF